MTAQEVFGTIATLDDPYLRLDEEFIRGLAGRMLGLPGRDPIADDAQVVEWWAFARRQYTEVHPEFTRPTDAQVIGGQLFSDRMGGDY